jgi:uncharacterized spore protein YtfJ
MTDSQLSSMMDKLGTVNDAMTVSRVFGDPYQVDGISIVPVAVVRGGGGGGGGDGGPSGEYGQGGGLGFGVNVRPVGVYAIKDGKVTWQPAVDVMRVIVGGQLLALAAILTVRRLITTRRRRR